MSDGNGMVRFENSSPFRRKYRGYLRKEHHVGPGHVFSVVGYLVDAVDKIQDKVTESAPDNSGEIESLRQRVKDLESLVSKMASTTVMQNLLKKKKRGRPPVNKVALEDLKS
jgi:hypothetical protein